jgi:hypothetical protein
MAVAAGRCSRKLQEFFKHNRESCIWHLIPELALRMICGKDEIPNPDAAVSCDSAVHAELAESVLLALKSLCANRKRINMGNSPSELKSCLKTVSDHNKPTPEQLVKVWDRYDANKDGDMDSKEMATLMIALTELQKDEVKGNIEEQAKAMGMCVLHY